MRRQVRPFGANALLASYTEDGPQLYSIDTSGVSARFFATAMGKVYIIYMYVQIYTAIGKARPRPALQREATPRPHTPPTHTPHRPTHPYPHTLVLGRDGQGAPSPPHGLTLPAPRAAPFPSHPSRPNPIPAQGKSGAKSFPNPNPNPDPNPNPNQGKNGAKSHLEKLDLETLTCREAVTEVAKILYSQARLRG